MSGGLVFGVPAGRVRALVAPVREEDDPIELETVFARAAWSTIAEPGDSTAGALVLAAGPARALSIVLSGEVEALQRALDGIDPGAAGRAIARWRPRLVAGDVLTGLETAGRRGVRLDIPEDPDWHVRFADLGVHAPLVLWRIAARGVAAVLDRSISVIGSRAATDYGKEATIDAVAGLVARGFTIVSGAAYGIDGIAHRAALASEGTTVAFLAGGLDRFYPSGHTDLIERIARTGAVLSEVPCGTPPTRFRFLLRNRLIAAASRATIVIEAGARSGSINTAGHASELGRPLGALPGSVHSASSAGCHRLLREYDAVCVTDAGEMAELASGGDDIVGTEAGLGRPIDPTLARVLDALGARPATSERVAGGAGLSVAETEGALMLLELSGAVLETATGWRRS